MSKNYDPNAFAELSNAIKNFRLEKPEIHPQDVLKAHILNFLQEGTSTGVLEALKLALAEMGKNDAVVEANATIQILTRCQLKLEEEW